MTHVEKFDKYRFSQTRSLGTHVRIGLLERHWYVHEENPFKVASLILQVGKGTLDLTWDYSGKMDTY